MSDQHRDFWIEVLRALEPLMKRSDFLTWFQHVAILERTVNTITLGFPVVLSRDWVANKYAQQVLAAVQACDPTVETVLYEVDGKLGQADDTRSVDVKKVSEPIKKMRKVRNKEEYTVNKDGVRSKTLNPKYTLESYIIGPENRLAHAACIAVSQRPGMQ